MRYVFKCKRTYTFVSAGRRARPTGRTGDWKEKRPREAGVEMKSGALPGIQKRM